MKAARREGVLPALLGEAVAAVDRPVLGRLERDLAGVAAVGAGRVVHLAGAAVAASTSAPVATSSTAATPGLATRGATLGFLVFPLRVELLVVRAEHELGVTLHTGQVTVFVGHSMTSSLLFG